MTIDDPPKTVGLEPTIQEISNKIQQLRVTYRRFFAGALDVPPDAERLAISRKLKVLRNISQMTPVDRFRITNLEAQFNSYCEMFGRRVRDQEQGYTAQGAREFQPKSGFDVEAGVVFHSKPSPEGVEALYQGLAKRGSRLELDTFRSYLDKQIVGIRKKTGCSSVQFRLVSENGKVRLKAKPIGAKKRPSKE